MFNSKRDKLEKPPAAAPGRRLIEAVLQCGDQGLFLLDDRDKILLPVSRSLAGLFRREDFGNLTFEKLLGPLVNAKTLTSARHHITTLLGTPPREIGTETSATPAAALKVAAGALGSFAPVDVRLNNPDGSFSDAQYRFEFDEIGAANQPRVWLVRVTDVTASAQMTRELQELRGQVQAQNEMLRVVLQFGAERFGGFLQKTDAAMNAIGTLLKKPAREDDAFRVKLEEILNEVDRVRREAAAYRLSGLENAARIFEDSLQDLRSRNELSGSDFLPLAVKLDELYGQFAQLKSLTLAAGSADAAEPSHPDPRTPGGTAIIETPNFGDFEIKEPTGVKEASPAPRMATAGSLERTLESLTELVSQQQNKQVRLETSGLELVPAHYLGVVKNVAIQLIRNAVMHGIELADARAAAGKTPHGVLRLEFKAKEQSFELLFEDDGCGLVAEQVRATAIALELLTSEAAARLRDREAIKLIFKSRYTTLAESANDSATHGRGLSVVRRYVHDAGGKIALASLPAHETRFKITLPLVSVGAAADADPASLDGAQAA